jgi:hypothetical protein
MKKLNFEQLMSEVSSITASGLPFMEGREKLEVKGDVLNNVLTVEDYGYLEGDEGEYVVITLSEYPENFIYGSSVVTQAFKKLDEKFDEETRLEILKHGLTFKLSEKVSKSKRKYTCITFFPK